MCQLIALVCLWVAAIFGVYKSILSCLGIAFFFKCMYLCMSHPQQCPTLLENYSLQLLLLL